MSSREMGVEHGGAQEAELYYKDGLCMLEGGTKAFHNKTRTDGDTRASNSEDPLLTADFWHRAHYFM